jgi:release factor glutamine methyltransferase
VSRDGEAAGRFEKLDAMRSVGDRFRYVRDRLKEAGVEAAALEARELIRLSDFWDEEVARTSAGWDGAGRTHDDVAWNTALLCDLIDRRLAREPLSRIVGHRAFWTIDLLVTPDALDPRSDTEAIVRAAVDVMAATRARDASLSILDLGTGTGAIVLALLDALPNARGLGVDISPAALRLAAANAERLSMDERAAFREGGWDAALGRRFDLVVSNPPYIPTGDIPGLDPEVRDHDPHLALDGGADGLDAYRAILPLLPRLLAPGGFAVLEIGFGQSGDVSALAAAAGLAVVEIRPDLGGVPRAMVLMMHG